MQAQLSPRHCERSEAIHSAAFGETWIASSLSLLAMTVDTVSRSRGALRPRLAINFPPSSKLEGAGKTGCLLHPRSRVRFAHNKMHTSIQGSGNTPAFPAQGRVWAPKSEINQRGVADASSLVSRSAGARN